MIKNLMRLIGLSFWIQAACRRRLNHGDDDVDDDDNAEVESDSQS
jgi:hypothetical protein